MLRTKRCRLRKLMDLGLTERLESLIAKRKARNMFKRAIERTLMDKGIAPILIVKNNILGASNNANDQGLQVPGSTSAPPILLPTQNLFDLPYDPFEEKPNLSADSVLQEFMPPNQKEMLFCRHESFCHGPLFTFDTSPYQAYDEGCPHRHNSVGFGSEIDIIVVGEKTEEIRETANDETEIEENNENPNDLSVSEVRMDMDSTKNNDSCSSPSSSDDFESGLDQTTKPLSLCANQVRKALNLSIPPKERTMCKLPYDSSPSPCRTEFNLFYNTYGRQGHTRNCSLASDLQVEVSEVGSTTLSTDGTFSPVEGDVTYDGDVDRDINSDSEELWGGSFNLTREANREKLRELDDIMEEDSIEVNLSGLNKKLEELIASISPSEQEAVQIFNKASLLSSRLDTTEDGASYPENINRETHEDVIRSGEEDGGFKTSNVSDKLSPEDLGKTVQLTENSVVHSPPVSCFQKPEQLIDPQQKPTEELNIICNEKVMTQGDVITLELKSSETRDDGVQGFIEPAALGEMRKPYEAINLDSCKYKHGNLETSYESKRTMDSEKKMEESQPLKYIEEDTHNLTKHDTVDAPNAVQSRGQPSKNIGEHTRNLTKYHNEGAPNAIQSIDDLRNVLEGTHVKEDSSMNSSKDESKTSETRQKAIMEPSKTSGATSAGSVKDTEHESRTLAKAYANAGLSTSRGESIKNSGDVQNLSSQESPSGALESKEDNPKTIGESISGVDNTATGMSVEHTIAMEASKPEKSEVKAVNTKENDINEVAK
ncbi:hypothetical protein V6N12_052482 [Hibiscus sabdariffa]|uniref:Uncharacterized protein n=1 Tax=Hibiscus sabdariffa TaxID=183260 RepID=A0ABR2C1M2_9ROSI